MMTGRETDLTIRPMTVTDLPQVIDIASALDQAPHYPESTWLGLLDPESRPARLAVVASTPAGEIHGFALASLLPPQAELETVAVASAGQRRGIARRLLHSLLSQLHQADIREIWLEVRASNTPAIALYRSLGFRQTGSRSGYYASPVEDALLMDLQIR